MSDGFTKAGPETIGKQMEANRDQEGSLKDTHEALAKLRDALNLHESAAHQEIIDTLETDYDTKAIKDLADQLDIENPFDLIERANNPS